jgi:hypothetical protein
MRAALTDPVRGTKHGLKAIGGPRRVLRISGFNCLLPSPRAVDCLVRLSHRPNFQIYRPKPCLDAPAPAQCVESPLDAFAPGVAGGPADVSCEPARLRFSEGWAHRLASTVRRSAICTDGPCQGPRCGKVNPQSRSSQVAKVLGSMPIFRATLLSEIVRSSTILTSQSGVLLR